MSAGGRRATVGALLAAVACGRGSVRRHDSTSGARAAAATVAGVGGRPACPRTGHWTACQVRTRLEQAGVAPRDTDAGALRDLPTLGSLPFAYQVGSAGLAVYLFPDSLGRHDAARALDTTKFVPPTRGLSMRGEGTAIQNDNLLALLFSQREQQRERVSDALMAGPPQP